MAVIYIIIVLIISENTFGLLYPDWQGNHNQGHYICLKYNDTNKKILLTYLSFIGSFLMPKVRQLGVLTPFLLFRRKSANTFLALWEISFDTFILPLYSPIFAPLFLTTSIF